MRALEILDAAGTLGDGNPLVFPMRRGDADLGVDATQDTPAASDRGRGARIPLVVPGLGHRGDKPPARGGRGGASARGPEQGSKLSTRGRTCSNGGGS